MRLRLLMFCLILAGRWIAPCRGDEAVSAAVRNRLRAYMEVFNNGDATALADFWAEDAVWNGGVTGEQVAGRDAIVADFAAQLTAHPGARLEGAVDEVHAITADVATCRGTTTLTLGGEPTPGRFSAVLVKQGEAWRLKEVEELPAAATSADALEELGFLVGQWRDESSEADVLTTVRWAENRTFLVRSFRVEQADGAVRSGTQVIGWDPRNQQVRSWSFESDGAFGEGTWVRDGQEWIGRLTSTLSDGAAATGTMVLKPIDADTLEVRMIGQEIEGQPLPSAPAVKVVRVAAAAEEPTAQANSAATIPAAGAAAGGQP